MFAVRVCINFENFRSVGDVVTAEIINKEIEHRENARHIAHIVARQQCHRQRKNVESGSALVDDTLNAENHQREQNHGVEPHQVPVIGYEEAAERIEHAERCGYG